VQSGDNFINVLRAAFTLIDPKCVKKIDKLTVILMHLGSAIVKAACKTLMKLSPGITSLDQWFSTQIAPRPVYLKKKFSLPTIENFLSNLSALSHSK